MAFLTEKTDGALSRGLGNKVWEEKENMHCLFQAFLVNWHLDGDMRKVMIDFGIRVGFDCRVVHRVFVILGYWTEAFPTCQSSGKRKGG